VLKPIKSGSHKLICRLLLGAIHCLECERVFWKECYVTWGAITTEPGTRRMFLTLGNNTCWYTAIGNPRRWRHVFHIGVLVFGAKMGTTLFHAIKRSISTPHMFTNARHL
jgi:hypothetical protein